MSAACFTAIQERGQKERLVADLEMSEINGGQGEDSEGSIPRYLEKAIINQASSTSWREA